VYSTKNAEGEVIYVGKAKSLRAAGAVVISLRDRTRRREKPLSFYARRSTLNTCCRHEKEALALENNLIQAEKATLQTFFAARDKTYPYVKLTSGERFPRVY